MCFKPQISLTSNTVKEISSIHFIEELLIGKVNLLLSSNDKTPNIDGYIELLDETNRICGKIAVQVKTVNGSDEGKKKFPCPTSLFGYADNTTDIVFLFAVDHANKWVLCKHISRSLIKQYSAKSSQDSVTIHFSDEEVITSSNVEIFLSTLKKVCNNAKQLFFYSESILEENKQLKSKIMELNPTYINLSSSDIKEIQTFFECYNNLLDNEFLVVKEAIFRDVWKRGIAISVYTDSSVEYSLFNIKEGELLNPIVQIPKFNIFDKAHSFKYDFAQISCARNLIKENPRGLALSLIKGHLEKFLKGKAVIPASVSFLKEYAYDYISEVKSRMSKSNVDFYNIDRLIGYLEEKYPNIQERNITLVLNGRRHIYINTIYNALCFLRDNGETHLESPYPLQSSFSRSHNSPDVCNANAFEKCKIVLETAIKEYQHFIYTRLPQLAHKLDLFQDNNLIIGTFLYSTDPFNTSVQLSFFKSDNQSDSKILLFEDMNNRSEILKDLDITLWCPFYDNREVYYQGQKFNWVSSQNLNARDVVFGKYNAITLFYKFLEDKFRGYFKDIGVK